MSAATRLVGLVACLAAVALSPAATGALAATPTANLPAGFRDEVVFDDLMEPTAVAFAPGGRVFVAERAGKVLVFDGLADQAPAVFADLRTEVYDNGDRGLLGLALDPDFPARPYVYVLYTYDHILGEGGAAPRWGAPGQEGDPCPEPKGADACLVSGRLVRLTVDGEEAVDEQVLVEDWCQQFSSHSIGDLKFGPGGALYASGGEGASFTTSDYGQLGTPANPCGDPAGEGGALRSQDLRTTADPVGLGGTIIRIDPDTGAGLPGNPMYGSLDQNARRIVAIGLRNPFRFAIAPDGEEIYSSNVGWGTYEEIDRFAAVPATPYNSGWPCYEGNGPQPIYASLGLALCQTLQEGPGGARRPFFLYRHGVGVTPEDACRVDSGSAASGLAFYEGGSYPPAYDGTLFFADSVRGCIFAFFPGDDGRPDPTTIAPFLVEADPYPGVDLEIGPGGDLFYVKMIGEGGEGGSVHRVAYDPEAPVARVTADPRWGDDDPLTVHLDASASADPQGEPLSFEWDLDENGTFETVGGAERTEALTGDEDITVSVRVTDGTGKSSVDWVIVYPGNTPPEPMIEEPEEALKWRVGERIEFSGFAEDEGDDEELPKSSLYWRTRLYHCPAACHAHPLQVFPAVDSGSFIAPDHDYPAQIEISLTATDSIGLAATTSIVIDPSRVDLAIASDPPGLELSAGHVSKPAPFDLPVIEGASIVLSAPPKATLDGQEYAWSGWSDGGDRVHTVVAEDPETYTATYEPVEEPAGPDEEPAGSDEEPGPDEEPAGKPVEEPTLLSPAATRPPRTMLSKRPATRTYRRTARFGFFADPLPAHFRCRLDGAPFTPCQSPRVYRGLRPGSHSFRAYAVDSFGVADPSPVVFRWRVLCVRWPGRQPGAAGIVTRPLRACARRGGSASRRGR